MSIPQPTTYEKRQAVASTCTQALHLELPVLVDDMQDTVAQAYHAWPDRLFIVDPRGHVAFRGEPGPRGFDVGAMTAALTRLLAAREPPVGRSAAAPP